jgi:simple sugar transport system permease protein
LAIVIFGGWSPIRGAVGALLFGATKQIAIELQQSFQNVPAVVFNSIPWFLLIGVLLLVGSEWVERLTEFLPKGMRRRVRRFLKVSSPMALGATFNEDR